MWRDHLPAPSSGARVSCPNPNTKNTVSANLLCMSDPVTVEIVGLKYSSCSPFPCDADRTCGLSECHPSGRLTKAFDALSEVLKQTYGDKVDVRLTLIDDNVPDHIRAILEKDYPPIPMILVNGKLTRIGRIALDRIKSKIEQCL